MDLWCPFAVRDPVPNYEGGAGPMQGGGSKILHHTTEGSNYAGARATYATTGDLPHFTDSFEGGEYRVAQHLPLDVGATALVHNGGITNTDNVIQIEHVGFATDLPAGVPAWMLARSWPGGYLSGIARLCRWIEGQTGCPAVSTVQFTDHGFGAWPGRLTWDVWNAYTGHLGHMHAPENDHGDPGPMNIVAVLSGEGDDMTLPQAVDPQTGGTWTVKADGSVFTDDGAPYLGGLNNHPEFNAGGPGDPAVAVSFWKGNDTPAGGQGYKITTLDFASGSLNYYRFPRDGSLSH